MALLIRAGQVSAFWDVVCSFFFLSRFSFYLSFFFYLILCLQGWIQDFVIAVSKFLRVFNLIILLYFA